MKKEINWISSSESLPMLEFRDNFRKMSKRVLVCNLNISFVGVMYRRYIGGQQRSDVFVSPENMFPVSDADYWAEIPLPD